MVGWKHCKIDGSQDGATRSNDTAKLHNSVWTFSSSTNFRGGVVGKIEGYGFERK